MAKLQLYLYVTLMHATLNPTINICKLGRNRNVYPPYFNESKLHSS